MVNGVYITQGRPANQLECKVTKTHKEIVRIMVFSLPCQKDGQATSNTKARAPLPGFSRVIWDEWGKKGVRMDTKALKKQMGAAIAMVLVAAVALGSATFAWFVSNNKVDATTSKISAQSNSAFMYIRDEKETSTDLRTDDSSVVDTALFPAHWVTSTESAAEGNYKGKDVANFFTAFGTSADEQGYTMNPDSLEKVIAENQTAGSPEAAVDGKYAVKNVFYVGSKGADLTNLKVESCSITAAAGDTDQFDSALRVLVKCGDNWVLCGPNTVIASSDNDSILTPTVSSNESKLEMFVFYDGDDAKIYTNNLDALKTASKRINVVFTATSTQTDKNN